MAHAEPRLQGFQNGLKGVLKTCAYLDSSGCFTVANAHAVLASSDCVAAANAQDMLAKVCLELLCIRLACLRTCLCSVGLVLCVEVAHAGPCCPRQHPEQWFVWLARRCESPHNVLRVPSFQNANLAFWDPSGSIERPVRVDPGVRPRVCAKTSET